MQANQEHIDIDVDTESERRPYQAPTLTFEGSLYELTGTYTCPL